MELRDAQAEMRLSYVGGGVGALVSACVWFAAAFAKPAMGLGAAFAVLFFGGMLIYPVSTLLSRYAFGRAAPSKDNTLGMAALESTIAMIGGLFVAYLLLERAPELVFPVAAIAVGTHYFAFRTVYGDPSFWVFGALITAAGLLALLTQITAPGGVIAAVAVIEVVLGLWLILRSLKSRLRRASP